MPCEHSLGQWGQPDSSEFEGEKAVTIQRTLEVYMDREE